MAILVPHSQLFDFLILNYTKTFYKLPQNTAFNRNMYNSCEEIRR